MDVVVLALLCENTLVSRVTLEEVSDDNDNRTAPPAKPTTVHNTPCPTVTHSVTITWQVTECGVVQYRTADVRGEDGRGDVHDGGHAPVNSRKHGAAASTRHCYHAMPYHPRKPVPCVRVHGCEDARAWGWACMQPSCKAADRQRC